VTAALRRANTLDGVDGSRVDLLVIGAGIIGSRIAYEAARHGLRALLVDAGDFGGATSSASSKLVHGGLRYLATGNLRLVRELQRERHALMTSVAPRLVRPLPMLLAVEREHTRQTAKLVAALALYAGLAHSRRATPRIIGPASSAHLVPSLDTSVVRLCGLVKEGQTHDARLTIATVRAAAAAGASVLNYVRLVAFDHCRGRIVGAVLHDVHGNRRLRVRCKGVVNSTGPWIDHIRHLECATACPVARLSKGVHAVLALDRPWSAGLALFNDSRSALAVPWQGMLLVGTTDTEYDSDPDDLTTHSTEIETVLAPLRHLVTDRSLDASRVLHTFAGLRVLPRGSGATTRAPRHHVIESSPTGLISTAGGKLTTHRTIATEVLRRLPIEIRPRKVRASPAPLPGADLDFDATSSSKDFGPDIVRHLHHLYGSYTRRVLAYGESNPEALERIHDRGPDVMAQALFAYDEEYALTVDDIASRRTTLAARGLADETARARIAAVLDGPSRPTAGRVEFAGAQTTR
jgi:glycerol-3-phosphate dehydrogenase